MDERAEEGCGYTSIVSASERRDATATAREAAEDARRNWPVLESRAMYEGRSAIKKADQAVMPGPPNTGVRKPQLLRLTRENVGRIYTLFHSGQLSIRWFAAGSVFAAFRLVLERRVAVVAILARRVVRG